MLRSRDFRAVRIFALAALVCASGPAVSASSLKISAGSTARAGSEVEADYTTSHLFVNEVADESIPITIFFDPQVSGVLTAEVYTNLNRRDRAALRTPGGIEEGILPPDGNSIAPGNNNHYFAAYTMNPVPGGYQITLMAKKCGAYRVTARYRLNGDPPNTYRWYGSETNAQNIAKRDHAIVVSPSSARGIQLYEANPLTILATGTSAAQRGTLADLGPGLGPGAIPQFSLQYLKALGCNMVWLQPIHPRGLEARQMDPATGRPYELGSPYSVKNFFEAMPLMAKSFTPGGTPQGDDTPAGRAQAMLEFQNFVKAADAQNIGVMLDAPFNHTAHDVELGDRGQQYWGSASSSATAEIRAVEARVFSRSGEYDLRSNGAAAVAPAPDRFDFGKWSDVFDIFFGRYAALVTGQTAPDKNNYLNEGDWFDYSVGLEDATGQGNGHFDAITAGVWRYFGDYLQYWLDKTGYPANTSSASLNSAVGIDGLRADFAQGLPPQCWEYLVNRTRARKWNFVFMAESLDGGPVTYRSARHFDVLNENLIYDLYSAMKTDDYRAFYDRRRNSYGPALLLLNTSSQDEDNYKNPFEAFIRFAANSTLDGVPMIFPGQELGLSGTIVPPNRSAASAGPPFGYERYDVDSPAFPKPIPSFMAFNSMMPLWQMLQSGQGNSRQLRDVYAAVNAARAASDALRSGQRSYLNLRGGAVDEQIFSVAKMARRNASPAGSDVVLAFVNLTVASDQETSADHWFDLNIDSDGNGVNDLGIQPDRMYNVKNLAAYTGVDAQRRNVWLWPQARSGKDLLANGVYIHLNRVPVDAAGWQSAPWEAEYLKLFDVTTAPGGTQQGGRSHRGN